jgi:hypothetical protein
MRLFKRREKERGNEITILFLIITGIIAAGQNLVEQKQYKPITTCCP